MSLSYKLLILLICSKFQRICQVVCFHGKPPTYNLVYKVSFPLAFGKLKLSQLKPKILPISLPHQTSQLSPSLSFSHYIGILP